MEKLEILNLQFSRLQRMSDMQADIMEKLQNKLEDLNTKLDALNAPSRTSSVLDADYNMG